MSDQAIKKLVYRNRLDDLPDHYLFFGAFIVGAAGIAVLKLLAMSQWIVTAWPVVIMIAYAIVAYRSKRFQLRADRIGENLYYLGFLFTLISLAVALMQFSSNENAAQEIIANFGIAIFSTIIGLAGRVFFYQLRQDPVDYEREARMELGEAANSVRDVLRDTANNFEIFKDSLAQRVEEGMTDVVQRATVSMTQVVENFSRVGGGVVENIDAAFQTFTAQSARLNEIAAGTVDALEQLLERLNKIDASPDLVNKKFEPLVVLLTDLGSELTDLIKEQSKASRQIKQFAEVALQASQQSQTTNQDMASSLKKELSSLQEATKRLTTSMAAVEEQFGETSAALGPQLTAVYEDLSKVRGLIENDVKVVREHKDELDQMLTHSRTMLKELHGAMTGLAKSIVEDVNAR